MRSPMKRSSRSCSSGDASTSNGKQGRRSGSRNSIGTRSLVGVDGLTMLFSSRACDETGGTTVGELARRWCESRSGTRAYGAEIAVCMPGSDAGIEEESLGLSESSICASSILVDESGWRDAGVDVGESRICASSILVDESECRDSGLVVGESRRTYAGVVVGESRRTYAGVVVGGSGSGVASSVVRESGCAIAVVAVGESTIAIKA